MILEVYDLECLSNLFTYTGYSINDKRYYQFVIHYSRNNYKELINHLRRDPSLLMIGYNNEGYDYPMIHHLINHYDEYINLSGAELTRRLYQKSQDVINQEFSAIADYNKFIKQLDLFKIWHFDNKAKYTR